MKIELLEKEQAAESIRPIYEGMEKKSGRVINMYKVMAHKPNVLGPFLEFYKQVWAPGALDPKIKELAYLRTSIMNGCTYCSRAHTASAKRRGVTDEQVQALKEPGGSSRDVFTEEERAVIQFAEQLTAWPAAIQAADLETLGKFFNTEQIEELVLTIATANLTNRFNEGMKTPVDV
ncbi:MAG: carboxymuconolactone decarboxylase family protein [Terriglobia bacterium]|jgi:uncharacterized peroxidase-related enzyme